MENFTDTEKVKLSELWVGDKVLGYPYEYKNGYGDMCKTVRLATKSDLAKKKSDVVWRILKVSKIVKGKKTKENPERNREGGMITIHFEETEHTVYLKHWNTCVTV